MIARIALTALLLIVFGGALLLGRVWLARRDRRIVQRLRSVAGVGGSEEPSNRIVYFTTDTCAVCRTQQEPTLERIRERVPHLRIERHDAVAESALAAEFGVLSVPTTAVYRAGSLVAINRGFAPIGILTVQLQAEAATVA